MGAADMALQSGGACDAGEGQQALPHGALWAKQLCSVCCVPRQRRLCAVGRAPTRHRWAASPERLVLVWLDASGRIPPAAGMSRVGEFKRGFAS